jgi:serine protease inhibitor
MPLLSPYSIKAALAMTYAYAAGDTRAEMAKVLHPFVTRLSPVCHPFLLLVVRRRRAMNL